MCCAIQTNAQIHIQPRTVYRGDWKRGGRLAAPAEEITICAPRCQHRQCCQHRGPSAAGRIGSGADRAGPECWQHSQCRQHPQCRRHPQYARRRSRPGEKLVALTFDDGPSGANTPKLLEGLQQRGVHATFFLVGSMVENQPELAVRLVQEGHQVGIHTYNHDPSGGLRGLSEEQFDAQVGVTQRMLTALTGQTEFALRPPYGFLDEGVRRQAPGPIILWSVDPEDWKYRNTEKVTAHILSHVQDGDIVLLHDIFPTSVEAALQVVDTLQAQGWRFVTVDELFALRGVELMRGESYHNARPEG